jgi:hypothetical protein
MGCCACVWWHRPPAAASPALDPHFLLRDQVLDDHISHGVAVRVPAGMVVRQWVLDLTPTRTRRPHAHTAARTPREPTRAHLSPYSPCTVENVSCSIVRDPSSQASARAWARGRAASRQIQLLGIVCDCVIVFERVQTVEQLAQRTHDMQDQSSPAPSGHCHQGDALLSQQLDRPLNAERNTMGGL